MTRTSRRAAALAVQEPPHRRNLTLYGTRAQLAAADGGIAGHFALAGTDRRAGVATYALRIDNNGPAALRAMMYCFNAAGARLRGYPLDIAVAPYSRCDTLLPVRMNEIGRYNYAIVEVSGDGVMFSLEAPAPERQTRRFPWLPVCAASLALTFGCAFGAAAATPRIAMLAAPSRVLAGAPIEVPYAYRGWASLQYALKTADGRQISAGWLHDAEGTLRFRVPAAAGNNLVLNVEVAGPFGERSTVQRIAIAGSTAAPAHVAVKPMQTPRIASFALKTPAVHAGGDATFTYATNAADGNIWLIDESGRLWASEPIDASGETSVSVPQGAAGHQLRAVMRVKNGGQDAVSSIALTVLPGALVTDASANVKAADSAASPTATLALSTATASAGETITVSIVGAHGDASILLNDSAGNAVESGDVSDGQNAITFTAPSQAGTYYVVASVTEGIAQQTLVKTLTVK